MAAKNSAWYLNTKDNCWTEIKDLGVSKGKENGLALAGDYGTAIAADFASAMAGDYGTAICGAFGTATVGEHGTAIASFVGEIRIRYYDEKTKRWRTKCGYVGEDGIEENVAYRLNANHEFEDVKE